MRKTTTAIVVISCLFSVLSAIALGQDTKTLVSGLQITGNENISRNGVLSYIKTRVGQPYSEDVVKSDCEELRKSGRFSTVKATAKKTAEGIIVTYILVERAIIAAVELQGNREFSTEKLLEGTGIRQGGPLSKAAIEAARKSIINTYKEEGFHYVDVQIDQEALASDKKVIIKIVEGSHVVIDDINFEGNHYFNKLELKIKTKTKAKMWPFVAGNLNREKIDRDVANLRQAYLSEGFLDVEVSYNLEPHANKKKMDLTFIIKEGGRYRVNEILFRGNTVFSGDELRGRLKLQQFDFFTSDAHRADVEIVESAYGELGYIEASVIVKKRFVSPEAPPPAGARHLDGGRPSLVNLVFEITERDQYRLSDRVEIKGNTLTRDNVIRRELRLYPEDLCNTVALKRSEGRLRSLRIFDPGPDGVSVSLVNSQRPGYKDALIEVKEGNTAELMLGVGVDSNSGVIGTVSITQRNFDIMAWPRSFGDWIKPETFKGAGQRMSLVAQPGTEVSRYSLSWSTPYIFDQPYSFGIKGYYFEREYESYDLSRIGVQVSVGHEFENRWRGEISTRLESADVSTDSMPITPVEVYKDRGTHSLLSFRGGLIRDRTDDPIMPSEGDRFQFGYEQTVGDYTFGTFDASYSIYRTVYKDALGRKHILAGRVSFGQIVGDAPVFEKFYGGGIGSLRGFEFRGISPRGTYPSGLPSDDPIGGDTMVFLGAEYSFPIVGRNFRGVVFIDSGTVEDTFGVSNYRVSTGFGMRWTVPQLGPIPMSLNFGFPLLKQSEDDEEIFSFTLGASI